MTLDEMNISSRHVCDWTNVSSDREYIFYVLEKTIRVISTIECLLLLYVTISLMVYGIKNGKFNSKRSIERDGGNVLLFIRQCVSVYKSLYWH